MIQTPRRQKVKAARKPQPKVVPAPAVAKVAPAPAATTQPPRRQKVKAARKPAVKRPNKPNYILPLQINETHEIFNPIRGDYITGWRGLLPGPLYEEESVSNEVATMMRKQASSVFPYYVTASWIITSYNINTSGEQTDVHHSVAVKIRNVKDILDYATSQFFKGYDLSFTKINIMVKYPSGKQKLINVARYTPDNCVVNIIKHFGVNCDNLYKYFPHLTPKRNPDGSNQDIYISHNDIKDLAHKLRISLTIYSRLGAKLNIPWHTFKYPRGKSIHIEFSEGHARIRPNMMSISGVRYMDLPIKEESLGSLLVVDRDHFIPIDGRGENAVPKYYTVILNSKFIMLKSFKPSSVTGNEDDDQDKAFHYLFTPEQILYKIFRDTHDLKTVTDNEIKKVIASAEHFVGRSLYERITPDVKLLDNNKSFVSYANCGYYMGFPDNEFMAIKYSATIKLPTDYLITFYICNNIENAPTPFYRLYKYSTGHIVIAAPVYNYLIDCSAVISVEYCLISKCKDISIIDFAEEQLNLGRVSALNLKAFRNTLLGRTIGGGLDGTKQVVVRTSCKEEYDQIVHECDTHDITFTPLVCETEFPMLKVNYKTKKNNGKFQFHSYILAYSSIFMMMKWCELTENNCRIAGFNVDSIFYYGDYDASDPEPYGGWKYEKLDDKPGIKKLTISNEPISSYPVRTPCDSISIGSIRYTKHTLIIGAAGIGKSHEFKVDPMYDQLLTTPTKCLREEHRTGDFAFLNTVTLHKYIQFSISEDRLRMLRSTNKVPRIHRYVVVDECTMYSRKQWNIILERAGSNTIIIAIGDFEQLRNSIDSIPVNVEYFEKKGFDVIERVRDPTMICRHSWTDGLFLDTLRGKSVSEQKEIMLNSGECNRIRIKSNEEIFSFADVKTSIFISDTHSKLHEINLLAKKHHIENNLLEFPAKDRNGIIHQVDVNSNLIWWDRTKMLDEIPKGFKYEPAFAMTPDSLQGRTYTAQKIYVDISITRVGAFYTSVTRTRTLGDTFLVCNQSTREHTKDCCIAKDDISSHALSLIYERYINTHPQLGLITRSRYNNFRLSPARLAAFEQMSDNCIRNLFKRIYTPGLRYFLKHFKIEEVKQCVDKSYKDWFNDEYVYRITNRLLRDGYENVDLSRHKRDCDAYHIPFSEKAIANTDGWIKTYLSSGNHYFIDNDQREFSRKTAHFGILAYKLANKFISEKRSSYFFDEKPQTQPITKITIGIIPAPIVDTPVKIIEHAPEAGCKSIIPMPNMNILTYTIVLSCARDRTAFVVRLSPFATIKYNIKTERTRYSIRGSNFLVKITVTITENGCDRIEVLSFHTQHDSEKGYKTQILYGEHDLDSVAEDKKPAGKVEEIITKSATKANRVGEYSAVLSTTYGNLDVIDMLKADRTYRNYIQKKYYGGRAPSDVYKHCIPYINQYGLKELREDLIPKITNNSIYSLICIIELLNGNARSIFNTLSLNDKVFIYRGCDGLGRKDKFYKFIIPKKEIEQIMETHKGIAKAAELELEQEIADAYKEVRKHLTDYEYDWLVKMCKYSKRHPLRSGFGCDYNMLNFDDSINMNNIQKFKEAFENKTFHN